MITEGKILEKKFIPAHTETLLLPFITKVGNSPFTNFIPVAREYEDQWIIIFEGVNEEGETDIRKIYTDEETYNSHEVGDNFVYVEDRDEDEPEYTEEEL